MFKDGEMVEKLCVCLEGNFPPTDSLIMRYVLILSDEDEFRDKSIKHHVLQCAEPGPTKNPASLVDEFKRLKLAA